MTAWYWRCHDCGKRAAKQDNQELVLDFHAALDTLEEAGLEFVSEWARAMKDKWGLGASNQKGSRTT